MSSSSLILFLRPMVAASRSAAQLRHAFSSFASRRQHSSAVDARALFAASSAFCASAANPPQNCFLFEAFAAVFCHAAKQCCTPQRRVCSMRAAPRAWYLRHAFCPEVATRQQPNAAFLARTPANPSSRATVRPAFAAVRAALRQLANTSF